MGAVLGLVGGIGLLLIFRALTTPQRSSRRTPVVTARLTRLLRGAGIETVTPAALISLCGLAGLLVGATVLVVSRTPPVALAFGLMAAYAPIALVRSRVRRRLRDLAEVWPEAVDNLARAWFHHVRPQVRT